MTPDDLVVLELSSFQLMDLHHSCHIAVVTNLAPNHLDVHRDMAEYIDAKKHIFTRQTAQDVLILNADNAITAGFAPEAAERYGCSRGRSCPHTARASMTA